MPNEPKLSETSEAPSLNRVVNTLAGTIARALSPGDVAALRRMEPGDVATPAFWKLAGTVLEHELRGDGPAVESRERQWAMVVAALATTAGLHAPGRSLGAGLAEAGLSELRLTRLLRAHGDALPAEVRGAASYLAAKAMPFDGTDLAWLVLSDGSSAEEQVRRSIAKSFFGQLARTAK